MRRAMNIGCGMFFAVVIATIIFGRIFGISGDSGIAGNKTSVRTSQVTLKAKPWNDGYVHVWHNIVEVKGVQAPYTDVREGTRCIRLDNKTHPLIGEPPLIYYYFVDCNGVRGYVEVDQVR